MEELATVYDELRAYKRSRTLSVAIKCGLLELLLQGPMTLNTLSLEKKICPSIAKILLNILRNYELVAYSQDIYSLTKLGHQAIYDPSLQAFADYHEHCFGAWEGLPKFCNQDNSFGLKFHNKKIKDLEFCEAYIKSMDSIAKKQIESIESICETFRGKILDIGSGPSTFGRFIAGKNLCNVTALDFPAIVDVSKKIYGTPENLEWIGIDFMQYCPARKYDIAYCSHVLEYFSGQPLDEWLGHIKNILISKGKVIFICFLRDDNPDSLQIDLDMFELSTCLNGPFIGQVPTENQILNILKKNGFEGIKIQALPTGPSYGEYIITCHVAD